MFTYSKVQYEQVTTDGSLNVWHNMLLLLNYGGLTAKYVFIDIDGLYKIKLIINRIIFC